MYHFVKRTFQVRIQLYYLSRQMINFMLADLSRPSGQLLPLFFPSFRDLVCSLWVRYAIKYSIEELYQSALSIYNFVRARDVDGALHYIETSTTECISGNRMIY